MHPVSTKRYGPAGKDPSLRSAEDGGARMPAPIEPTRPRAGLVATPQGCAGGHWPTEPRRLSRSAAFQGQRGRRPRAETQRERLWRLAGRQRSWRPVVLSGATTDAARNTTARKWRPQIPARADRRQQAWHASLVRLSTGAWKWLIEALTEQSIWVSRTDGSFPHTTR